MKLEFTLSHKGTPVSVATSLTDIVAFERAYGVGVVKAFTLDHMRYEHQLWMAWHVLHRTGKTTETFDVWLEGVADFNEPPQEAPAAPLDETATTGS